MDYECSYYIKPVPIGEEIIIKSRDGVKHALVTDCGETYRSGQLLDWGHNMPCMVVGGRPPARQTEPKVFYILASTSRVVHIHAEFIFKDMRWVKYLS